MWIEISNHALSLYVVLSCHVCGMWIEILMRSRSPLGTTSCHVCGMWIERTGLQSTTMRPERHATYVACGLKSIKAIIEHEIEDVMPRMWHVD